jgi:iron complex outermembrane receptor protein
LDTVDAYATFDLRLAWRLRKGLELSLVGQNLTQSHHAEFGTNPFVRSPLVEIERSTYAKLGWRF